MPEPSRDTGLTERLVARVRRQYGGAADSVLDSLVTDLAPVLASTSIDPERIAAAVVLAARGDARRLRDARALAHEDVRDLLHGAGLAGSDWRAVLDRELGGSGSEPAPLPAAHPSHARSWRSGVAMLLGALLLCGAAFGWIAWRDARADDLLHEGDRVAGVVTAVDYGTTRMPASFRVRYSVDGREREEMIAGQRPAGKYVVGDRVEVVVDPDDPTRIRTVDEPNVRTWPATLVLVLGFVVLCAIAGVVLVVLVAWGVRRRAGSAPPRTLAHREPMRPAPPRPRVLERQRDWLAAYHRGALGGHFLALCLAFGVAVAGALWLEERSSEALLDEGIPVAGTVETFDRDDQGRTVGMDVRYALDGAVHVARVAVGNGHVYEPGQEVTVLVDPEDPTHVRTTEEANTRIDWRIVLPLAGGLWLALLAIARGWRAVRRRA